MNNNSQDLLADVEQPVDLIQASIGARFAHYIVDTLFMYAVVLVILFFYGMVGTLSTGNAPGPEGLETLSMVLFLVFYFAYYIIGEGVCNGRTLGKLITGSVVLREDGSPVNAKDAFVRTISRIIPFEPFSTLFGKSWHDTIARTGVVKKPK